MKIMELAEKAPFCPYLRPGLLTKTVILITLVPKNDYMNPWHIISCYLCSPQKREDILIQTFKN